MVEDGPPPDVVADRYGASTVDEGMALWLADVNYERSQRNKVDEWGEEPEPEPGAIDDALALVRDQTNATEAEWARVEDAVRARLQARCQTMVIIDQDLADTLDRLQAEADSIGRMPAFVGMRGIAELFGVGESAVRMWRKRGKLPPPDEIVDQTMHVWARSTIKEWAKAIKACG